MKASIKRTVKVVPLRHSKASPPDIVVIHVGEESRTWEALCEDIDTRATGTIKWKRASGVPEAVRQSRVIQVAAGTGKASAFAPILLSLGQPVRAVDIPVLMGMLVDRVPVIVGKGAISEAIWMLKSEATRLALPFEVAESQSSYSHTMLAWVEAVATQAKMEGWRPAGGRDVALGASQGERDLLATALTTIKAMLAGGRSGATAAAFGRLLEILSKAKLTELEQSKDVPSLEHHKPLGEITANEASRSDVLGTLPGVVAATRGLRSESGRLDADKIADLFGMRRVELARLAGVTAEAIRQTPDSPKLQPTLGLLERCARLLVLNPDKANFRAWLNTQNSELDDQTPLEAIRAGKTEMVADLVEDVLTNRGG